MKTNHLWIFFYFSRNRNCKILDVIRPLNAALDQLAMIVSANSFVCQKLRVSSPPSSSSSYELNGVCDASHDTRNFMYVWWNVIDLVWCVWQMWAEIYVSNICLFVRLTCGDSQFDLLCQKILYEFASPPQIPLDKSNCLVFFDFFFLSHFALLAYSHSSLVAAAVYISICVLNLRLVTGFGQRQPIDEISWLQFLLLFHFSCRRAYRTFNAAVVRFKCVRVQFLFASFLFRIIFPNAIGGPAD